MPERLLQVWASFRSRQSFWSRVATRVPCVVTWFLSCRHLLGRDIVFSCRGSVAFLYCDDVTIAVSLSRPRRPRQVDKRLGVTPFVLQQVWSWQGFISLDRVFFLSR